VEGGYIAAKYLLRGNHRHIAFFASLAATQREYSRLDRVSRPSRTGQLLITGPPRRIQAGSGGIFASSRTIVDLHDRYDFPSGYATARDFLSRLRDFDVESFAATMRCSSVLQALDEQHIAVPQQVSILGYDDSFFQKLHVRR
jgi:LacI family transcriptional regulator